MTEALEWLIEHQDDSDDEEDDETDFLSMDTMVDPDIAGPSSSANAKRKSLKDACTEFFEAGNSRAAESYSILFLDADDRGLKGR